VFGLLLNTLLGIGLFGVAYKVLPVSPVRWRQVWRAAVFASVTWEVAKIIFVYYLLNFARLNVVYGSVGVVIALLTWGYITAAILLFGGELSALIVQKERAGS
jgi:membrane protein